MPQYRFRLASGDRNVGTVYLPDERAAPLPVLVVCFGGASDRRPNPFTAELRIRGPAEGLAVVPFDVYGWGDTGGDPDGWTYGRWARNLADVCSYVRAQPWADGRRIGAIGTSAGSTAVLRCAIDTRQLAFSVSVATFLGHFVSMPNGPAKQLVDNLDTLQAGGTGAAKGRGDAIYRFGLEHFTDTIAGAPIYRLPTMACPVPLHRGPGRAELLRRFPRALLPPEIGEDGWDHGGDNVYAEFFERAQRLATRLQAQFAHADRLVVIGHGGCLNYLLHALLGIPATAPVRFALGHCSLTALRLVPGAERRRGWPLYPPVAVEVICLNDIAHLATVSADWSASALW